MVLTFACGHRQTLTPSHNGWPVCPECGETKVSDVRGATPRIAGCASGPHVRTQDLEAVAVNLATSTLEPSHAS